MKTKNYKIKNEFFKAKILKLITINFPNQNWYVSKRIKIW